LRARPSNQIEFLRKHFRPSLTPAKMRCDLYFIHEMCPL